TQNQLPNVQSNTFSTSCDYFVTARWHLRDKRTNLLQSNLIPFLCEYPFEVLECTILGFLRLFALRELTWASLWTPKTTLCTLFEDIPAALLWVKVGRLGRVYYSIDLATIPEVVWVVIHRSSAMRRIVILL
ncbi:hypothetical protein CC80DRAFT_42027, partial [Byssothecium circinans]